LHHANRDNRRRPIFWQHGSARLELYVAMRKSRQRRCNAAISRIAASNGTKLLDAARNFGQAISFSSADAVSRQLTIPALMA